MILKIISNDREVNYIECQRFIDVHESKLGDVKDDALIIGDAECEDKSEKAYLYVINGDSEILYEVHYNVIYVLNDKGQTVEKL